MRSIEELRVVAAAASGTTRVAWYPKEALAVLTRMLQAEAMAGAALCHARNNVDAVLPVLGLLDRVNCKIPEDVLRYYAQYYPGKDVECLWSEEKKP